MVNRRGFVLGAAGVGAASLMASATASAGEPAVSLNVVYPNHDGARFDTNYYRATHIPLAMKVLNAASVRLIEGMPNGNTAPPIAMIACFEFASVEAMKAGLANPAMAEVRADIAKFTDIKPLVMQGRTI